MSSQSPALITATPFMPSAPSPGSPSFLYTLAQLQSFLCPCDAISPSSPLAVVLFLHPAQIPYSNLQSHPWPCFALSFFLHILSCSYLTINPPLLPLSLPSENLPLFPSLPMLTIGSSQTYAMQTCFLASSPALIQILSNFPALNLTATERPLKRIGDR